MEFIKIIGIAFVTVITSILIKSTKPELSFAVTITGVIIILLFILDGLQGTITLFNSISQTVGVDNQLIKILLKIIGVGYITEFASGILSDFGGNTISDKVVLGGKITILLLSMPIIENLLQILKGFVHLL